MDIERKDKIKRILKRVYVAITSVISVVFIICVVVACSQGNKKQNNNVQVACAESEVIDIHYDNKKFISYNDESYSIVLTPQEVSDNVFSNVYGGFSDHGFNIVEVIYNGHSYFASDEPFWTYVEGDNITLSNEGVFSIVSGYESSTFEFDLTFTFSYDPTDTPQTYYYTFKDLFASDLGGDINSGIFTTLTTSVVSFVGSLNSGITAMTNVFYDSTNNKLTTIGVLSVIVVAVSLCYWLFRLIIGLIRMRG